jgi:hypothetical protein
LNFFEAKYDFLKIWPKIWESRSFRDHNSSMAGSIKLRSKNRIMRQSSGTIHTLDVKNRFTSNRVTRDTKLSKNGKFCITCNSLPREPIFYIQRMNCSPRCFLAPFLWPQLDRSSRSRVMIAETSRVHLIFKFLV